MFKPLRDAVVPLGLLAGALVVGIDPVVTLFVIVGYAHFVLGYIYRVRSGRESVWYLVVTPLVVLTAFTTYFFTIGMVAPVFILTSVIFATHFAADEFFLRGETLSGWNVTLLSFIGIDTLLSIALVVPAVSSHLHLAALALLFVLGVRLASGRVAVSPTELYLSFIGALLFLLSTFGFGQLMLGVVVLLHCYNWYHWGHYRARTRPDGVRVYWRDVGLTFGGIVVLFVLSLSLLPEMAPLFNPTHYYYVYFPFAIAHIATSVRFGMLRG